MDTARYHRGQSGQQCAQTHCGALSHALCAACLLWGVVGVCLCIRRTVRHCRAVRAACGLLGLVADRAHSGFQR